MVRAERLTDQQIEELVEIARADAALWEQLKKRELENEKRLADAAKQGVARRPNQQDTCGGRYQWPAGPARAHNRRSARQPACGQVLVPPEVGINAAG
jgi:hypothetical protein